MGRFDPPFGGKPLIGSGDFCQVVPVVKGGGECATLGVSVKSSRLWPSMHIYSLTTPFRSTTITDPQSTRFLDEVGEDFTGNQQDLSFLPCISDLGDAINFLFNPPPVVAHPLTAVKRDFSSVPNVAAHLEVKSGNTPTFISVDMQKIPYALIFDTRNRIFYEFPDLVSRLVCWYYLLK
ncbi:hypothetical protein EV363DRAFT_1583341 [Boletus edulis]|nr:hypothetical protein EV363DRAFT_1583341 [Boletus edulis]